jgi:hypothetical protein
VTADEPMQLVGRWDWRQRLAAGLATAGSVAGGIAGGALALGSGIAALPALAVGGAVAAVGGAGYLAYRHFDGDLRRLEGVRGGLDARQQPVLADVLDDQLALARRNDVDIYERGSTANNGDTAVHATGGYAVRLDANVRDRDRRTSYLSHELTHVDANESYSLNAPATGLSFFNAHGNAPGKFDAVLRTEVTDARETLARDGTIARELKAYLDGRLMYAWNNPRQEFDTVINEVLIYMHLKNVPPTSPTYRAVEALARAARDRRRGTAAPETEARRALPSSDPHWGGTKLAEWEEFRARNATSSREETPSYIS